MLSKNQQHFQDLLKRCLVPRDNAKSSQQQHSLIKMAFPERVTVDKVPMYCVCHNEAKFFFYRCPNCQAAQCELSASCKICRVLLVSAVHLSRTTQSNRQGGTQPYVRLIEHVNVRDALQDGDAAMPERTIDKFANVVRDNNWKQINGLISSPEHPMK
jgi:hypothetical protein